jgi:hypothetical protein
MNTQQAYEEAIKLGKVQAAKVFKKQLNEQAMALLAICEELFPESATDSDYAALDNLISSSLSSIAADLKAELESIGYNLRVINRMPNT